VVSVNWKDLEGSSSAVMEVLSQHLQGGLRKTTRIILASLRGFFLVHHSQFVQAIFLYANCYSIDADCTFNRKVSQTTRRHIPEGNNLKSYENSWTVA
jgi:hypothetical protein